MAGPVASQVMTASCANCGGVVALTLAGPAVSCQYCNSAQPLESQLLARLQSMRARLANRKGQERQFTGKLIEEVDLAVTMAVQVLITTWLLFGGWALGFALIDHDLGLLGLARGPPSALGLEAQWWTLFGLAVGLPLSLGLWGIALFRLRGLSAEALPLPPAYPGARPRCRCCGAELPAGTALRRCQYCQTDSMVVGEHYRRAELNLDRALDAIAKTFERSLETELRGANRAMMISVFTPILLLVVGPLVGVFIGVSMPGLWPLAAAALIFCVVGLFLPTRRKLPKIEPLSCVALGTKLSVVGSHPRQVNGQLLLPIQNQFPRVYNIIGDADGSFEMTMYLETDAVGSKPTVHRLTAGGKALDPGEESRLEMVELWLPGISTNEGVRVETVCVLRQRKAGFRLWRGGRATAGAVPTWTAGRMKERPLFSLL